MSSSRVFDKTPFFQPEKILDKDDTGGPGWQQDKLADAPSPEYRSKPLYEEVPSHHTSTFPQEEVANVESTLDQIIDAEPVSPVPENPVPPVQPDPVTKPPAPEPVSPIPLREQPEVQQLLEQAHQQGLQDGLAQAVQDFHTSTDALLNIAEQLNQTRETILQNSIGEMQDLVLTIAEKIIRHSITAQDDTIVTTVEEAIRQAVKSDEFYICIHQDDYDVINEKTPELISKISGLENIFIKIDNNIDPGGCMIESDNCTVDATVASQLQIISDEVKSRR